MFGGFASVGVPGRFCRAIVSAGIKDIHVITNDSGNETADGIGTLICGHCVKELTASHIGMNPQAGIQLNSGEMKVNLIPQGTLVERIRCGGAGLGGFLTATGIGTLVEKDKTIIHVGDRDYLLELPLRAELAVVKAWKADTFGNLVYRGTGWNFNPVMALAADFVIAEVDELVGVGELDHDRIGTPGVCIDMVIQP